mgnify:CR=1 FL=1
MKKIFKYICRKVDEKVANSVNSVKECINSVNECIKTVSDKMKDKEDLYNFGMIFKSVGIVIGVVGVGAGLGAFCLGNNMIIKSKIKKRKIAESKENLKKRAH